MPYMLVPDLQTAVDEFTELLPMNASTQLVPMQLKYTNIACLRPFEASGSQLLVVGWDSQQGAGSSQVLARLPWTGKEQVQTLLHATTVAPAAILMPAGALGHSQSIAADGTASATALLPLVADRTVQGVPEQAGAATAAATASSDGTGGKSSILQLQQASRAQAPPPPQRTAVAAPTNSSAAAAGANGKKLRTELLHLPLPVLACHMWPHLSPWSRMQLRATCREVRDVVDAMPDMEQLTARLSASELEVLGCEGSPGAAAGSETAATVLDPQAQPGSGQGQAGAHLWPQQAVDRALEKERSLCGLLMRWQRVRSLKLHLTGPQLHPPLPFAMRLGSASHRLLTHLHLHLKSTCEDNWFAVMRPELLRNIAHACPALQQLELQIKCDWQSAAVVGSPDEWDAAARTLPPTLYTLSIGTGRAVSAHVWRRLVLSLAAATQLTELRSLSILSACAQHGGSYSVAPLTAIANQLTHLALGCPYGSAYYATGRAAPIAGLQTLLSACSATLTSLKLPAQDKVKNSLFQLLQLVPHLRSLDFELWGDDANANAAVLSSLSQLRGLTRLAAPDLDYMMELGHAVH